MSGSRHPDDAPVMWAREKEWLPRRRHAIFVAYVRFLVQDTLLFSWYVMVPLMICSIISLAIIFERILSLRLAAVIKPSLARAIHELGYGGKTTLRRAGFGRRRHRPFAPRARLPDVHQLAQGRKRRGGAGLRAARNRPAGARPGFPRSRHRPRTAARPDGHDPRPHPHLRLGRPRRRSLHARARRSPPASPRRCTAPWPA